MIYQKNNAFIESSSPHSLGLQNNLTVPNPGWDQNSLLINEKKYWGANNSNGFTGLRGLTFDGTGLLGTGLFAGDFTTWGWPEMIVLGLVVYFFAREDAPRQPSFSSSLSGKKSSFTKKKKKH